MPAIITGNIWRYHEQGFPIVITTNGDINSRGECVMGKGIAFQTKQKYPKFPSLLANHIHIHGNTVGYFKQYNIFSFPVKHHWYQRANLSLIGQSCEALRKALDFLKFPKVYSVKPGIGNGKLDWEDVIEMIDFYFANDNRFTIVDFK